MTVDYVDFLRDLVINVLATYVFVFLIYYRRHGDRDTAVMLALFNAFLFTIVIAVTFTEINIAAGFALFAVLSIISLRSVNIAKVEAGYLFGAIALALINGISFQDYILLALCNAVILIAAAVLDSSLLVKPTMKVEVTLDGVTASQLSDLPALTLRVQEKYDMQVAGLRIEKFNPDKGSLRLIATLET